MPRTHVFAPPYVPGTTFVREQEGIHEYRLEGNGLTILLAPHPDSPVAGFMVTYRVGSRNEALGYTGATHLLEHLMFKGSENYNREKGNDLWNLLEAKGALVNATTWTDRTNYFEVLPRELLPTAISFEADRMRRARIREEDRVSEMPVVRNEYERGENQPFEALDKQLWALAYEAHPYHHSTIGWRSDIENVPIERLKAFYDDFYWPDNATVTVAGGFDEAETLAHIAEQFGAHPKAPHPIPALYTVEPKQEGERRVTLTRAGGADMMALAHKIPQATHPDMPALVLLSLILSDGKTSRLYRSLVDTALATSVTAMCYQFHDPSLFTTYVTLSPRTAHAKAELLVKHEYARIAAKGVEPAELTRAKKNVRAAIAARRDGPYAFLSAMNEEIAAGDWTRFTLFPRALSSVTSAKIREVAKRYFTDDAQTAGWFVSTQA
ncbi:MAG: insulinase family protein [Patescibacteria group bacterium]|nr:insulinase family protein [Patescibacteria group bacterium]MDE1965856.1 insulinase family protein [Patescibacteria group bacterium]